MQAPAYRPSPVSPQRPPTRSFALGGGSWSATVARPRGCCRVGLVLVRLGARDAELAADVSVETFVVALAGRRRCRRLVGSARACCCCGGRRFVASGRPGGRGCARLRGLVELEEEA